MRTSRQARSARFDAARGAWLYPAAPTVRRMMFLKSNLETILSACVGAANNAWRQTRQEWAAAAGRMAAGFAGPVWCPQVLHVQRRRVRTGYVRGTTVLHRRPSGLLEHRGAAMCARGPSGPDGKSRVAGCRDVFPCGGTWFSAGSRQETWRSGAGRICRVRRGRLPGSPRSSARHVKAQNAETAHLT